MQTKNYKTPSGRGLLVAEKPSAMNEIKNVYFKIKDQLPFSLDFTCCAGHVIELAPLNSYRDDWGSPYKKEVLPIIPTDSFPEWKYIVSKHKFFDPIETLVKNNHYDFVINAGDAGREGQLIQERVYHFLKISCPIYRFWADDLTEETIKKTFYHLIPNEEFKNLTDAAYLRAYSDFLVGINFSRAATLSLERNTAIGRVMTAVLSLVCRRENEIDSFVPSNYYQAKSTFVNNGVSYVGYLINKEPLSEIAKNRYAFKTEDELKQILKDLPKQGEITERKEQQAISYAPHLYNLTDLQKDCSKKFNYTPKLTLATAQSLYEKKLLSYPRTESRFLTTASAKDSLVILRKLAVLPEFAPYIVNIFGNNEHLAKVLSSKKYVNDSKVSDHPALIPTGVIPDFSSLSKEEKNIFSLVLKRLIAIFMPPYVACLTTVTTACGSLNFETKGLRTIQNGWKDLYPEGNSGANKDNNKGNSDFNSKIPPVSNDKTVVVQSAEVETKETTPPNRYTYESLLQDMEFVGRKITNENYISILKECAGLGTPATRAEIIDKLLRDKYLTSSGKTLSPSIQGTQLIDSLSGFDIISPELTAKWELALKRVENGDLAYDTYYSDLCDYVRDQTGKLLTLTPLGAYYTELYNKCPKCNSQPIIYADGWRFAICQGVTEKDSDGNKACDFVLPKEYCGKKLSKKEMVEILSGGKSNAATLKFKNGKTIYGSVELDENLRLKTSLIEVGLCPFCNRHVVKGSNSFYCSGNLIKDEDGKKACEFSISNKIGTTKISDSAIAEILDTGETSKPYTVTWNSGKTYSGALALNKDKTRVEIKEFTPVSIMDCPYCDNGTIMEGGLFYFCNHIAPTGTCKFKIYKQYMEAKISVADIKKLASGKTIKKKLTFNGKEIREKELHYDADTGKLKW